MEQSTSVILSGVDARVDAWLPTIQQVQGDYLASKGRYAQALLMASVHPRDGNNTPLDRPSAHPSDQAESPEDLFAALPGLLRGNVRIDTYGGPQGQGYVVPYFHEITSGPDKGVWNKALNFGPETWRDSRNTHPDTNGWFRIEEVG